MSKFILSDEEIALFRGAVKDAKPLKPTDKVEAKPARQAFRRVKTHLSASEESGMNELSDHLRETVTQEQVLFFAQPGLPQKLLRDLKQGRIKQTAILDLHGYTIDMARDAVLKMIEACIERGIRCFRIIHGKGKLQNTHQPVLKNHVNNWLQQHKYILAFCSAKPADGGAGAVYVLLKNLYKLNI